MTGSPSRHTSAPARFDEAIADFAEAYADLNERDHGALAEAIATGGSRPRPVRSANRSTDG